MADQTQTLKLVLQMQADVADAVTKTTTGLKEIQAQAVETARVVNSVGQTTVAVNPANVQYIAQSEARMTAMLLAQEKGFANVEQQAAAEARLAAQREAQQALINAQMDRRVIIETQLEAAEAALAGNPALATKLEREAEIRTRALGIQRTLNITTEESIALAERLTLAQEAGAVAATGMGVNLSKAKTEAMVLGRELASGTVRASTMSSLLGSMGSTVTIAAIAGYELYSVISHAADAALELAKNNNKIATELHKVVDEWVKMASGAQNFADQTKLADHVKRELDRMAVDMADFRLKQLPLWKQFWDSIAPTAVTIASGLTGFDLPKPPSFQADLDKQRSDAQERYNRTILDANLLLDKAKQSTKEWADAEANLPQGLADYTQKLSAAQSKLAALDAQRHANMKDPAALAAYEEQLGVVNDLKDKFEQLGTELDKSHKKSHAHAEATREMNAVLRDQANILAQIKANQQSVTQTPFLSDDQKNAQMLPLVTQEAAALAEQLKRDQAEQAKLTDPGQWNRMQGAIIQAKARITELGFETQKLSFLGGVRAELTNWVNSFGTTAKQVASIITGTLNTAIQGTSAAITGLIFRTTTLKQAAISMAQSMVQNILQILFQWIASQTIMKGLSAIFKSQDVATTGAAAAASAAAWAPAATAASIATEGAADATGVAALSAAMASGTGIVAGMGAFATGGFTGGREGAPAGIVHGKEYVFSAPATARLGVSFLDSLHSNVSRPGYERGGFVGSSSPASSSSPLAGKTEVHVFNFTDAHELTKAVMKSNAGKKIIVDTVKGVSWQL